MINFSGTFRPPAASKAIEEAIERVLAMRVEKLILGIGLSGILLIGTAIMAAENMTGIARGQIIDAGGSVVATNRSDVRMSPAFKLLIHKELPWLSDNLKVLIRRLGNG
jgi:hypothetical protein